MNYIVLDLEFNQPFAFKSGIQTILNPECPFEIIQIGAVKLNNSLEIVDRFNFMIQPQIYPRIHPYVEKITGITLQQIKDCPPFPKAYDAFLTFIGHEKNILCTWGIDDIKSLYKNILYYNLDSDKLTDQYINVQNYATKFLNYEEGKNIGLKNCVLELNLEMDAAFHNALNDAAYTAEIFRVVCPTPPAADTFHIMDITKKKLHHGRINTKALLECFENKLERPLTEIEVNLIKSAYKLGRNHTYDMVYDKKTRTKNKEE